MIQANLLLTKDRSPFGFRVRGHALFDEEGRDIVCAGVSAIAINTVNSLEILCHASVSLRQEEGFLEAVLAPPASEDSKLLLRSFGLGMEQIRKAYGSEYLSYQEIVEEEP